MPEVVRGRVLTDKGHIKATLLDLAGEQALIQVTGILSPINGKVLRYERRDEGGGVIKYVTTYKGRPLYTIWEQRDNELLRWRLFFPEAGRSQHWLYADADADAGASAALASEALVALHLEQQRRGELLALARFDREEDLRQREKQLDAARAQITKACGFALPVTMSWGAITDAMLIANAPALTSIDIALGQLAHLCTLQVGRSFLRRFTGVHCATEATLAVRARDRILSIALPPKMVNVDLAFRQALEQLITPEGETLGEQILQERSDVCLAGDERVVLLAPPESPHAGLFYGRRGAFYRVESDKSSPRLFLDPRFPTGGGQAHFLSELVVERAAGRCTLRCGQRTQILQRAGLETARRILAGASYNPNLFQRQPHALARDQRGVYYYVDRATRTTGQKDYRVFIGPRGSCVLQQMKDVVSDSEGEIFSTNNGKLRLILGQSQAQWIGRGGSRTLLLLPIPKNLDLIFNQLGPYLGQRLGTPCDDI